MRNLRVVAGDASVAAIPSHAHRTPLPRGKTSF
jgi:hypothetical protein